MKRNEAIFSYFPMGFPSQYNDEETGLHYNYFRYYNSPNREREKG
jgi:RHS repeat-associated protein